MSQSDQMSDRIGAIAGMAFALLFFFGTFILDPLKNGTDQELAEWWTDGGLRRDNIVSMYLWLLAAPCFLVFVTLLRARLRPFAPESPLVDLVFGSGVVFVTILSIGALIRGLIAQAVRFDSEPVPGPDTLRFATQFSQATFSLLLIPFITFMVAAASLIILRTRALSPWIGWVGFVVSAVSMIAVVPRLGSLATPLSLIWIVCVCVQLLRTRGMRAVAGEGLQLNTTRQSQIAVS